VCFVIFPSSPPDFPPRPCPHLEANEKKPSSRQGTKCRQEPERTLSSFLAADGVTKRREEEARQSQSRLYSFSLSQARNRYRKQTSTDPNQHLNPSLTSQALLYNESKNGCMEVIKLPEAFGTPLIIFAPFSLPPSFLLGIALLLVSVGNRRSSCQQAQSPTKEKKKKRKE